MNSKGNGGYSPINTSGVTIKTVPAKMTNPYEDSGTTGT